MLLSVADFANDEGVAWPSIATIARKSSLSEDSVRRKLRKLSNTDFLVMTPRKDKSGRDTSYEFRLLSNFSQNFPILGKSSRQLPSQTATPPLPPATLESSTQPPSFLNHHIEPSKNTLSDFFETIWSSYPVKDGKKKARSCFMSTVKSDDDCRRIRQALDNYLAMLRLDTWRAPKNGDTWFNNWQDWENFVAPSAKMAAGREGAGNTLEELRAKGLDV